MRLDITCSTDNNYVQHCMAMLCSVFENNKGHNIKVHLLHTSLSANGQSILSSMSKRYNNEIIFYEIDDRELACVSIADNHPDLSIATYYRFFIASLLPKDIDKVLYLDCDVIVLQDISELFSLDLDGYGVAAVKDVTPENDLHRQILGFELDGKAFCAGVMMINLEYWREHNCQRTMLDYANKMGKKLIMEDQDVLNHEFRGCWFELPYKYGRTPMSIAPLDKSQKYADIKEYVFHPAIIHYAAFVKPWLDIRIPDDKFYWKYVKLSMFMSPQKTKVTKDNRSKIRKLKFRYYVNFYLHPFIPDLIEMFVRDVLGLLKLFAFIFRPNLFAEYRLKRWLKKY